MVDDKDIVYFLSENKAKGINEIIASLGMSKKNKKKISKKLEELEILGEIVKIKGNRYTTPEKAGYLKGEFQISKGSFGFVDGENESAFIPRGKFGSAMSGDTVLVNIIVQGTKRKKSEGEIVKILKRSSDKIIGIFQENRNFGFVVPTTKMGKDIFISRKYFKNAKNGDLVLVEILNWGEKSKKPEGKIIEVLGDPYDTNVMIDALIKKNGYNEEFPKEVKEELKNITEPDEKEKEKRKDLREIALITIDGEDARDLDDAVYVEKLENNNYKLIVSIADVSYYVKEGSELDKEALNRGNSVYLVDRVIPMFPRKLSNGICSLNEKVDRLAYTVEMEISKKGKLLFVDTYKSVINVKHRMTYGSVNKILKEESIEVDKYSDIYNMLKTMRELADILKDKRLKRGSIDFDFKEKKVVLNEKEKVEYIKVRSRDLAESLIEEFMLSANEAVAEKLFWYEIPSIYRIHEKPDVDDIKALNKILMNFGYKISNINELHPGKFQKIIEDVKDKEYSMLVNKVILMSLKQAKYNLENLGHFGLAASYYTHFTSPIRRYADLIVHRILDEVESGKIKKKRILYLKKFIDDAAKHISKTERDAEKAERESVRIKIVEYMIDKIGEEYNGIITGLNKNGMFIELENYVECFFNTNNSKDEYIFDENKNKVLEKNKNKSYNIGDAIKILVVRVELKDLSIEVIPYEGDENGDSVK